MRSRSIEGNHVRCASGLGWRVGHGDLKDITIEAAEVEVVAPASNILQVWINSIIYDTAITGDYGAVIGPRPRFKSC